MTFLLKPEPGDLILNPREMGDYQVPVPHSIIWLSMENKCIAEANDGNANGLKLGERKAFFKAEYYESLVNHVFRCKNSSMGEKAAGYARKWAVGMDDPSVSEPGKTYREVLGAGKKAYLKTPYQMRERAKDKQEQWTTTNSLFDAAKAWMRAQRDMPLSFNQGMGCAGFVTYCYQVASLEDEFGHFIRANQRSLLESYVVAKNEANVLWLAERKSGSDVHNHLKASERKDQSSYRVLQELKHQAYAELDKKISLEAIPKELLMDAASTRTSTLYERLAESGDFKLIGYLVGNDARNKSTRVGIIPKEWVDGLRPPRDNSIKETTERAFANGEGW